MHRIINVANRLPVTVGKTIQQSSGGLISALEGVSEGRYTLHWVGWPGKSFRTEQKRIEVERTLADQFNYTALFLNDREIRDYYQGFSNSSLWPLLHYMTNFMHYEETHWEAYRSVNERFARKVLEIARPEDTVWIHDYHLMLLPGMLRDAHPALRTGFFLHTPFPSSEIFRCHPRRTELIRGILGANLIGFHTFGYLRHFRSTVLRLLGLESEMGRISDANHEATLGVYPIGINARKFQETLSSEAYRERRDGFRENWHDRRIILSVERLDYTKGILHRLESVETFLERYPEIDDVVFVFVAVPSREEVKEYQELRERVEHRVGQINGRFATVEFSPIHFVYNPVPFVDLCALYSLASVALVTPLVDGMNLVAKEFVACQSNEPGVLVLSEFAGAAQELVNAISVNPYHVEHVAGAIKRALQMGPEERRRRMNYMQARVLEYEADYWARSYLEDLFACKTEMDVPIEFERAQTDILAAFERAHRPVFFLDYDGTLREFEDEPLKAFPHDDLQDLLLRLHEREDFIVYIVSGRRRQDLDAWLGQYRFGLIAEHGTAIREPGAGKWRELNPRVDNSWKERVIDILRHYEGSTPGSFVEEKSSSVVWHYRQSDPEFGSWKANQLLSEVYDMLANLPVEVHHGKKIVEVSSIEISKGAAVEQCLRNGDFDCAICAGDDQTDESMFRLRYDGMIRVKVGEGDTNAGYRISSPVEFRGLLTRILDTGMKTARRTAAS